MFRCFSILNLLAIPLATVLVGQASAALLLYEPFDYTTGDRLGGSGTSPVGKVAPNGQTWITRSPAGGGTYNPANDTLITAGNLSYSGLAPSIGNSVRYGSSANTGAGLYTDAIALPNAINSGSVYYSMIVRLNGAIVTQPRTSFTSLSTESADPTTDAGLGLGTSSGTAAPLPASAWIRNSGTTDYHLGSGKISTDGMGPSASAPSWQSSAAGHPYANQQGNTAGTGQDYATIADDLYFIVMKYTFNAGGTSNDTVSMWVNPIASTLGDNAGEANASGAGGSYYSAINANVTTANADASQIRSFLLIGQALASAASARSIDTSLDELRIGTTWADVTPTVIPEPGTLLLLGLGGLMVGIRRSSRS